MYQHNDQRRDVPLSKVVHRQIALDVRAESVDVENRTIELSFSSEEPYARWWGTEILDHAGKSINLGRLKMRAPVLVNHNPDDQVGVVEKAFVKDRRGYALVRFGKSARASEIFQDVTDGIRSLVSVGYQIDAIDLESKEGDQATYRVTRWTPYEVSLVAIPADPTVGVGRDGAADSFDPRSILDLQTDTQIEEENDMTRDGIQSGSAPAGVALPQNTPAPVDQDAIRRAAVDGERQRQLNIRAIGARVQGAAELVDEAIRTGWSTDEFATRLASQQGPAQVRSLNEDPSIGMSDRDVREFSVLRLMHALANPSDASAQRAAAFEMEASAAAQTQAGKDNRALRGHTIPVDVLRRPVTDSRVVAERVSGELQRRDLLVGTATAGGNTVATDLLSGSFIDLLRNRMSVMAMGATMLGGLVGNLAIPRQTGSPAIQWLGENGTVTAGDQSFDQVGLSPKTAAGMTKYSRRMLLQSSLDVEAFVRADLAIIMALGVDLAALNGSGASNQPRGVLQTAGIQSVAIGTNGGVPTWDHIVDLESAIYTLNADVNGMGYLTNARMRGRLKKTAELGNTAALPIWRGSEVNGYRALASNQVPGNLTKGTGTNLSAILFGNFADVLIGTWGGLDIVVDPFTAADAGNTRIVAMQDADVALRRVASFAAITDAA